MSALEVAEYDATLHNPRRSVREMLRAGLQDINARAASLLGLPLDVAARRFPSFVRGSIQQSAACYRRPHRYAHTGGPALMLVPGIFCMPSVFNRLGRELEHRGVDVHLPRPFPVAHGVLANTCRLERSAGMLVSDLEQLRWREGLGTISLAGHSLGGLIVLRAIQKAAEEGRDIPEVASVIVLASPLRGAPITRMLQYVLPACRDMVPGSPALQRLQPALGRIDRIMVAGADSLVPETHQMAPGAERICLSEYQHMDFYVGNPTQVRQAADVIMGVLPEPPNEPHRKAETEPATPVSRRRHHEPSTPPPARRD